MFPAVGRLKPGVTQESARAELAALGQRLAGEYAGSNRNWSFDVVSFRDQILGRTRTPTAALMPMLRETVKQTDPRVRVDSVLPMAEIVASTVAERRFLMIMVTTYAAVALAIAAVGIFGVVACQVAQRRNEFGIRLALGATPGGLVRLVLLQTGRLTVGGLMLGLGVSFATNRLLGSQLFGLSPHDPILLSVVSLILLLVGLVAGFVPSRRAARVDPRVALRGE